jgi:hypothetical protein
MMIVGANGRFYTLLGANLPGGRGMGEPVRLMVDLPNDADIIDMIYRRDGAKIWSPRKAKATGSSSPPAIFWPRPGRASRC